MVSICREQVHTAKPQQSSFFQVQLELALLSLVTILLMKALRDCRLLNPLLSVLKSLRAKHSDGVLIDMSFYLEFV